MKTVWLLLDNRIGSANQARGIGLKLADKFDVIEKNITYNKFAKLPNILKGKSLLGLKKESIEPISKNFPDLVISASRRTAPIARWIKKQSKKTKAVQIIHPGNAGLNEFDLLFVPQHDKGRRKHTKNITYTFGAPHKITQDKLSQAKQEWQQEFSSLPKPITAAIIGGGKNFNDKNAQMLADALKDLKNKIGGSLLITTSARTPNVATQIILEQTKNIPSHQYIWGQNQSQSNPYLAYLACADSIVVTGDSVSMASEACATGKPVFIFAGEKWLKEKHSRFIHSLFQNQYACALEKENTTDFKPQNTLDCADFIANKIKNLFN